MSASCTNVVLEGWTELLATDAKAQKYAAIDGLVFGSSILASNFGCRDIGIEHVHLLILKLNGRRTRSVPVRYKTKLVSCDDLQMPWPNMFRSQ